MASIVVNGTTLPAPTSINSGDEIIWSDDTGRSATGKMIGDVIADKKTLDITWEMLTESQASTIKSKLASGFFTVSFRDYGNTVSITAYRSTLQKQHFGYIGNTYYYRSVTVSIVQQ